MSNFIATFDGKGKRETGGCGDGHGGVLTKLAVLGLWALALPLLACWGVGISVLQLKFTESDSLLLWSCPPPLLSPPAKPFFFWPSREWPGRERARHHHHTFDGLDQIARQKREKCGRVATIPPMGSAGCSSCQCLIGRGDASGPSLVQ